MKEERKASIKEWIKDLIIAVIVAIVVMQFIKPTIVKERSMEPNFTENDYLFVSKQSYKLFGGEPQLGDVIIFKSSLKTMDGHSKLLIKRVIGVPGDEISVDNGKVFVNGKELGDEYTKDQYTNGKILSVTVPKNHVFVMGDNRRVSVDSRSPEVGFVDDDNIVGKVVFRLYPFGEMGKIKNPYKE